MVVELNKDDISLENFIAAFEKLGKTLKPGNGKDISKHFGKLKRGIDGVQYQREARGG